MIGVHHSSSANQLLDNSIPQSGCSHESVRPVISFSKTKQSLLNQELSSAATKDPMVGDDLFIFSSSAGPSRNTVRRLTTQDLSCSKEGSAGQWSVMCRKSIHWTGFCRHLAWSSVGGHVQSEISFHHINTWQISRFLSINP